MLVQEYTNSVEVGSEAIDAQLSYHDKMLTLNPEVDLRELLFAHDIRSSEAKQVIAQQNIAIYADMITQIAVNMIDAPDAELRKQAITIAECGKTMQSSSKIIEHGRELHYFLSIYQQIFGADYVSVNTNGFSICNPMILEQLTGMSYNGEVVLTTEVIINADYRELMVPAILIGNEKYYHTNYVLFSLIGNAIKHQKSEEKKIAIEQDVININGREYMAIMIENPGTFTQEQVDEQNSFTPSQLVKGDSSDSSWGIGSKIVRIITSRTGALLVVDNKGSKFPQELGATEGNVRTTLLIPLLPEN